MSGSPCLLFALLAGGCGLTAFTDTSSKVDEPGIDPLDEPTRDPVGGDEDTTSDFTGYSDYTDGSYYTDQTGNGGSGYYTYPGGSGYPYYGGSGGSGGSGYFTF